MSVSGPELLDNTAVMLSRLMEAASERQRVISNNIANVNTPGYKRRSVTFESQLKKMLESKSAGEIGKLRPEVVIDEDSPSRIDGNNVNMAKETNELLQNTMYHRLLSRAVMMKINILKTAIRGGGR